MNDSHATAGRREPEQRLRLAAARLLEQEMQALVPRSVLLTLCVIGMPQDMASAAVRLMLLVVLIVIVFAS
jgi:hypothetical protein